jgi:hypothetical protein
MEPLTDGWQLRMWIDGEWRILAEAPDYDYLGDVINALLKAGAEPSNLSLGEFHRLSKGD